MSFYPSQITYVFRHSQAKLHGSQGASGLRIDRQHLRKIQISEYQVLPASKYRLYKLLHTELPSVKFYLI